MENEHPTVQNIQERADELINSFRSSFWIDEHKWFVRCAVYHKTIHLQTLSNIFYRFENKFPDSWQSTYPDDDREKFHNTMSSIYHDTFFEQSIPSYICLQNIKTLYIKLPISDKFWSIIPSLERLNLLYVSSYDDSFQSQLQALFDHAPNLRYLQIKQRASLPFPTSLFKYTNVSVREFDLKKYNYQFNEEECMALTRSPLCIQCQILSIRVKNREGILILVENMINLQALHVKCGNEKGSVHIPSTMNDDRSHDENTTQRDKIVQWLKDRLLSTCLVSKDPQSNSFIRIWIK